MINEVFYLENQFVALCDLLKLCNVAQSGGQAKRMISDGFVSVNGLTETRKTAKITVGCIVTGEEFRIEVCTKAQESDDSENEE